MPDRTDATAAAGTLKNDHTKKRASVLMEIVTSDVKSSGSVASLTSPAASSTPAKENSPKKRRKVNHGQNDNPVGLQLPCDTRC